MIVRVFVLCVIIILIVSFVDLSNLFLDESTERLLYFDDNSTDENGEGIVESTEGTDKNESTVTDESLDFDLTEESDVEDPVTRDIEEDSVEHARRAIDERRRAEREIEKERDRVYGHSEDFDEDDESINEIIYGIHSRGEK